MRTRSIVVALALSVFLAGGGWAAKVETEHDSSAAFEQFQTFRWKSAEGPAAAELDVRLRAVAVATLASRGLREAPAGEPADLVLEYAVGLADQLAAGFAVGVDWWGRLVAVPAGDSNVTAGLVFLLSRAEGGEAVWTGWMIKRGTNENALTVLRERAPGYAKKILSRYPPR